MQPYSLMTLLQRLL